MADIKYSQLGAATAITDTDVLPMVNMSADPIETNKITAAKVKEYVIGNTDISGIGNGTATGAISALMSGKTEGTAISEHVETIGSTAVGDYAIGETFLANNGNYYEATAAITGGSTTLTVGTNCKLSTVDEQLNSLKGALTNEITTRETELTSIKVTGIYNNTGAAISIGSIFYLNGTLVKAIDNISVGSTLELNTNYKVLSGGALNDLDLNYYQLVLLDLSSAHSNYEVSTIQGREISNYGIVNLVVVGNGIDKSIRGSFVVPINFFKSRWIYMSYIFGGSMKEVDIKYVSDTKIIITNTDTTNTSVLLLGLKIS